MNLDWKDWVPYPYKNGKYACLSQPEYIRDRDELFKKNGNGWWVDGGGVMVGGVILYRNHLQNTIEEKEKKGEMQTNE